MNEHSDLVVNSEPGGVSEHAAGLSIRPSAASTMNKTGQTENVIDFAAYRARRDQKPAFAAADGTPYGAFMFAMPIMIPVIAWMPVWASTNASCGESLSE
jgi:hypothetical protein